jgi:hypothetical protein
MSSNDQVILEQIFQQQQADLEVQLSDNEFFERFVVDQALKNYDLTYDDIEAGIVDGGGDGGVDGIYLFANGEIVNIDTITSEFKRGAKIELFIIQAKKTAGFSDSSVDKLINTTTDLLNLSHMMSEMKNHYNSKLIAIIEKFHETYKSLLRKNPKLHISYIYASLGDSKAIHPNVIWKKEKLQNAVLSLFSDCNFDFQFVGASDLLQLYRKVPSNTLSLSLLENATSTTFAEAQGYLCLVSLEKYNEFIVDEEGRLRKNIFEANIRDYQGKVEVNDAIQKTLTSKTFEDFWWLNNGITVIATQGTIVGKSITLEDPQIVNGLQTSTEIYHYFKDNPRTKDDRSILVRIIVTDNIASRDKIIKATNSQTAIPPASLHATDNVQRDIEDYFKLKGDLLYDRRKNYYKNLGYSRDRILSIPYLAQAVMAIAFREPDNSRGRPSSLLKNDRQYARIFSNKYSMVFYYNCAKIMKRVDKYIRSSQSSLAIEEKYNISFHVAMYVMLVKLGNTSYQPQDIINTNLESLDNNFLSYCAEQVTLVFQKLKQKMNWPIDAIAKNKESTSALLKHFESAYSQNISS